jgi:hypothetical protein
LELNNSVGVVLDTKGVLPSRPEDLYRLQRLCLRIFGLLSRDIDEQAQNMAKAVSSVLKKKHRPALLGILQEELPVLIALYTLDRLAEDDRLSGQGLDEVLRSMLLPCFSISYQHLYDEPSDPLQHVLSRVDWYLDGDKGDPMEAFVHYTGTILGETFDDVAEMAEKLKDTMLSEMEARLSLAFRYEFTNG